MQISIDSKHDFALSRLRSDFKVCSALAPKIYYNLKAFRVCFLFLARLDVLEIPPAISRESFNVFFRAAPFCFPLRLPNEVLCLLFAFCGGAARGERNFFLV